MLVPDPRPDASEGATLEAHAPHGKTVFQRAKEAIEAGLAEPDDDVPTLPYGPSMPFLRKMALRSTGLLQPRGKKSLLRARPMAPTMRFPPRPRCRRRYYFAGTEHCIASFAFERRCACARAR